MATFSNGESGSSVRAKLNEIIEKVEGTSLLGNDIKFGDNDKAIFGAGSDLQIYHSGTHSIINDNGTGDLLVQANTFKLQNAAGTATALDYDPATGALQLYKSNAIKLVTTSTGVDVTGVITADGLTLGDAHKAIFGAGSDLQIYHDGFNSYIEDAGTGYLVLKTGGIGLAVESSVHGNLLIAQDDFVKLYNAGSEKLATTSTGVDVTGTFTVDGDASVITLNNTDTSLSLGQTLGEIKFNQNDPSDPGVGTVASIEVENKGSIAGYGQFNFKTGSAAFLYNRLSIAENGDISFYEPNGTTAKMVWDASADALTFGDNVKATFGAESDLQIYHDGANSYVKDAGDGNLILTSDGSGTYIRNASDQNVISAQGDAARMHYAGPVKLATTSTGVDVTGTVTADVFTQSNSAGTLTIKDLGVSSNEIEASGTLHLDFQGSAFQVNNAGTPYFNITSGGDISFYEDTGTTPKFFWDASAERLGIGTSSPARKFHLSGSSTLAQFESSTTGAYLELKNSGGNAAYIGSASGSNLVVETGGSERMRLDASGSLLVGKTSADYGATAGFESRGDIDAVYVARSGGPALNINRISTDGDIVTLRKDDTTVGSIGVYGGYPYIGGSGTTDSFIRFWNASQAAIYPATSTGATNDAAINIGGASQRFKDLYLSGGVYLGGTGAANLLDDYEEGTFTPAVEGLTTAGVGIYVGRIGYYTKIGNVVHFNIYFNMSAHTGTGDMAITGLPFTSKTVGGFSAGSAQLALSASGFTLPSDAVFHGNIASNSSILYLYTLSTAGGGTSAALPIDTAFAANITGSYFTA